jgi:hypothetical protein
MTDDFASMRATAAAETATKELADLAAQHRAGQPEAERPLTAQEAEARLVELKKAYDAQNPQPALQIETTTWPRRTTADKLDLAAHLSDLGVPDKGIEAMLDGKPYTAQDVQAAKQWKAEAMQNPKLRAKILSGDREAVRTLIGMSHLIATADEAKP